MSEAQSQEQDRKAQLLQNQYNRYQELLTELQSQLNAAASQIEEHTIVDKTLSAIPPKDRAGRKCFKMVGGVLVQKSIDDVIKILDQDMKTLNKQKASLESEAVKVKREMETWMKEKNVKIVRQ